MLCLQLTLGSCWSRWWRRSQVLCRVLPRTSTRESLTFSTRSPTCLQLSSALITLTHPLTFFYLSVWLSIFFLVFLTFHFTFFYLSDQFLRERKEKGLVSKLCRILKSNQVSVIQSQMVQNSELSFSDHIYLFILYIISCVYI